MLISAIHPPMFIYTVYKTGKCAHRLVLYSEDRAECTAEAELLTAGRLRSYEVLLEYRHNTTISLPCGRETWADILR